MSFVLHLAADGTYLKGGGAPLRPGQFVMLDDGLFALPESFTESPGVCVTVRDWRIPADGGHYLLRECLLRDLFGGGGAQ